MLMLFDMNASLFTAHQRRIDHGYSFIILDFWSMVHLTVICLLGIMFRSSLPTRKASMFGSSNISMEYKQVKECGLRLSSPPPCFKNTSMHGIIVTISICLGPFSRTYQAKGPSIGSLNQHFGRETLGFSTYLVSLPPFFFFNPQTNV